MTPYILMALYLAYMVAGLRAGRVDGVGLDNKKLEVRRGL